MNIKLTSGYGFPISLEWNLTEVFRNLYQGICRFTNSPARKSPNNSSYHYDDQIADHMFPGSESYKRFAYDFPLWDLLIKSSLKRAIYPNEKIRIPWRNAEFTLLPTYHRSGGYRLCICNNNKEVIDVVSPLEIFQNSPDIANPIEEYQKFVNRSEYWGITN